MTRHRVDRTRKSAKQVVTDFADELLHRTTDADVPVKLLVIQTIALRMNWTDLYERLRFRHRHDVAPAPAPAEVASTEKPEPWWQR